MHLFLFFFARVNIGIQYALHEFHKHPQQLCAYRVNRTGVTVCEPFSPTIKFAVNVAAGYRVMPRNLQLLNVMIFFALRHTPAH